MLGVQYAMTHNDQLEVDYIGNRGVRIIGGRNYNQLDPQYLSQGANFLGGKAAPILSPRRSTRWKPPETLRPAPAI